MNSFLQWLTMGGYASYVWPAYGLFVIFLMMNVVGLKWKRKQTWEKLQQWFKR